MSVWTSTQIVQGVRRKAAFVSMDGNAVCARSVEEVAFVSTGEDAVSARSVSVWRRQHLSAWAKTQSVQRNVEEAAFVSTDEYAYCASSECAGSK